MRGNFQYSFKGIKKAPKGAFLTFKYVVAAQRNLLFVNIGAVA
ncbi:hypothetical protein CSC17_0970 [Klebsiella oxytoca]|nr:hypothetical protein CSC17_0970 [Klebsiella oxytoca]